MSEEKVCADVRLNCGRFWLVVNEQYLVMQGDLCRDPVFGVDRWDEDQLRDAANRINLFHKLELRKAFDAGAQSTNPNLNQQEYTLDDYCREKKYRHSLLFGDWPSGPKEEP